MVPVSVTPEVEARTVGPSVDPKVMDWSIPTNSFAGEVEVIGLSDEDARGHQHHWDERNAILERKDLHEVEWPGELACVDAAEGEFAVGVVQAGRRLERDPNLVRRDEALAECVVGDGGDAVGDRGDKSAYTCVSVLCYTGNATQPDVPQVRSTGPIL